MCQLISVLGYKNARSNPDLYNLTHIHFGSCLSNQEIIPLLFSDSPFYKQSQIIILHAVQEWISFPENLVVGQFDSSNPLLSFISMDGVYAAIRRERMRFEGRPHGKDCSIQSFCISSIHGGQMQEVRLQGSNRYNPMDGGGRTASGTTVESRAGSGDRENVGNMLSSVATEKSCCN